MRRSLIGAALVALCGAAAAQEAAPELPVADWSKSGPVSLEDFRGQLTVLVFYDDNES